MKDINVALIEDDPQIRQLMTLIIDGSPGFMCYQAYESCEIALKTLPKDVPDLVLMDIDLPGMSGIMGVKKLKTQLPWLNIVMLTVHDDDDAIFQSLQAGAVGYLVKGMPPVQLLRNIQEAYQGGAPMSLSIARRVISTFHSKTKNPLSGRELEVLKKLCQGENYRTIAEDLYISTNTVKAHIKNIYKKLHVNSRAEVVSKALKDRLI